MTYFEIEKEFTDKKFVTWVKKMFTEEDLKLMPNVSYWLHLMALAFNAGLKSK